jgi:hypothetical protein
METPVSRGREKLNGGRVDAVDPTPLLGDWVVFTPNSVGIRRVTISSDGGRLRLGLPETDWPVFEAIPLAPDVDSTTAIGFLAEGTRADGQRVTLGGYLNRELLNIDFAADVLYRVHFHRPYSPH